MKMCNKGLHDLDKVGYQHRIKDGYKYKRCKQCVKEEGKRQYIKYKKLDPLYSRKLHLKERYGITQEDFEKTFKKQNNSCSICKTKVSKGKGFVVDHNHNTNQVRGILCDACNKALGGFQDNKQILKLAISYLEKWEDVNDR